ncbi:MAG: hypothetical protein WDA42_08590, partial [Candidatus Bathyarchaeia archaeon]
HVKKTTTNMLALVLILIVVCSVVYINMPKQPQAVTPSDIKPVIVTETSDIKPVIVTDPFMHLWQDVNLQPIGRGDVLRQEGVYIVIFNGIEERLLSINKLCEYDVKYVDAILRLRGENGLE